MAAIPAEVRINTNTPFPAMVTGGSGVGIGKQNGVWTVQLNTPALATSAPSGGALANDYVVVYDANTGTYSKVSLQTLQTLPGAARTRLTVDTAFYVSPTGSTSNTGLDVGSPWPLQYAYNTICQQYDFNGHQVTIQLADGTYTTGMLLQQPWMGSGNLSIVGNVATPANVLFNVTAAGSTGGFIFYVDCVLPRALFLSGMKLQTSIGGAACIGHNSNGQIFLGPMEYGPSNAGAQHIACFRSGGFVQCTSNYTISGGAGLHLYATDGTIQTVNSTVTVRNLPNFITTFAMASGPAARVETFAMTYVDQAGHSRNSATCTTTNASPNVTAVSINTNLLTIGMSVTGATIPAGVTIAAIPTSSTLTLSTGVGVTAGTGTLKFEIAKGMKFVAQIAGAINTNGSGLDLFPGDIAGSANGAQFAQYL